MIEYTPNMLIVQKLPVGYMVALRTPLAIGIVLPIYVFDDLSELPAIADAFRDFVTSVPGVAPVRQETETPMPDYMKRDFGKELA